MLELWQIATAMPNLILTLLLGLILLYWIGVILGVLDLSLFDFDLEMDSEVDSGFLVPVLDFGPVPFMAVLSIFIFCMWNLAILGNALFSMEASWPAYAFFVPNILASFLVTKIAAVPLKKLFQGLDGEQYATKDVETMMCTLLSDNDGSRLSQAAIVTDEAHYTVNVKARNGQFIAKGSRALIIEKDENQDLYYVEEIDGLE